MERKIYGMSVLALLLVFVPIFAHAHVAIFEGEIFLRPWEKPLTDDEWRVKVAGINGAWGPKVELGGQDWSFEFPFIIPPGEFDLARAAHIWLSRGDVDVVKYTAAAGERFCAQLSVIPPACVQYRDFYPVVGILGPGVPKRDLFPFQYPADCPEADCGFMVTNPPKAKLGEERPTGWGPIGAFPEVGYWYYLDWTKDVLQYWLEGPGNFYIVIYTPDGKTGDALAMWGWDECEYHYNPADNYLHSYNAYIIDEFKYTRIKCIPTEHHQMGEGIPPEAFEPVPLYCGPPVTPECKAPAASGE